MSWKNNQRLIAAVIMALLLLPLTHALADPPPTPPGAPAPAPGDPEVATDEADDMCGGTSMSYTDDLPVPMVPNACFDSGKAFDTAKSDNAKSGYCGRGVFNILRSQGFSVSRGNGMAWGRQLLALKTGWELDNSYTPLNAPVGAVLVYSNAPPVPCCKGGNKPGVGHVEIVATDKSGKRFYVSDAARPKVSARYAAGGLIGIYISRGYAQSGIKCGGR